jgi:hypothetical protein
MTESGVWLRLVLAVLATWRITHLLANEDGPWDLVVRLRARLGRSFAGRLMDCFYCLSVWVAAPLAIFVTRKPVDWLVTWLALSGAACLLERAGPQPVSIPTLPFAEEQNQQGENHNVLRSESGEGDSGRDAPVGVHESDNWSDPDWNDQLYASTRGGSGGR